MKPIKFKYECPNCDCAIEASFRPSTPDVFYMSNGDPGYPDDPAEAECQFEFCPECSTPITDERLIDAGYKFIEDSRFDDDVI